MKERSRPNPYHVLGLSAGRASRRSSHEPRNRGFVVASSSPRRVRAAEIFVVAVCRSTVWPEATPEGA